MPASGLAQIFDDPAEMLPGAHGAISQIHRERAIAQLLAARDVVDLMVANLQFTPDNDAGFNALWQEIINQVHAFPGTMECFRELRNCAGHA